MRAFAFLRDNVVVKVEEIDESTYSEAIVGWQNLVDVTDLFPQPTAGWVLIGNGLAPPFVLSTYELDYAKYTKRAKAKDIIIAEMAAENMARVRTGVWTVPQLVSLTLDAELGAAMKDVHSLSFELAAAKLAASTNALITSDIKAGWLAKLASHYYNS